MPIKASARLVFAAAALLILSPAASAQDEGAADARDGAAQPQEEEREFPWGVLGLAGLVGLLGPRKSERHIHVDARRNR